ncbi:MAG TPA: adenylate/guanylate cyclase domain-containing protein [Solirubrobacteraceae bacterium]|jgi:class 3 adenylate cyclase|nr:adenylate/guanylate cyclase domain-containing protein [Solirubrobacteraceae bacterium]
MDRQQQQHTFLFADLVGFTAFTERVGDEAAADVAVAFQQATVDLAQDFDCDVVKCLGDAVMIHGDDAARVVTLALRIARKLSEESWCPPLRMGVHSGTAVRRGADWYGATVNVAARLTDAAAAGEVLISLTTRDLLKTHGAMTIADRGPRSFKNVGAPVGVFAAAA